MIKSYTLFVFVISFFVHSESLADINKHTIGKTDADGAFLIVISEGIPLNVCQVVVGGCIEVSTFERIESQKYFISIPHQSK